MFDWNDARYFVEVAEQGSTLAAGRRLRVSQTTVARRIAALEQALGVDLFERRRSGYALTAAGAVLLEDARRVRDSAQSLADASSALQRSAGGTVRLTCEESFIVNVLPSMLRDLHELHPEIRIDLDASEDVRDLEAGAADIAIRVTKEVSGSGLVGRRVGHDLWTVYCSTDYAERHGRPRNRAQLRQHPLISGGGSEVGRYYATWIRENRLEAAVAMHHGSVTGLFSAVRSGLGLAALPCFVAELDPGLVRCLRPDPAGAREIWLLTHERIRALPKIRVVMEFLGQRLHAHDVRVAQLLAEKAG